jgi:methyltransferase (TIGR00027 family)
MDVATRPTPLISPVVVGGSCDCCMSDLHDTARPGARQFVKRDKSSQTAVMVCMARAAAHDRGGETNFSDPTALSMLAEAERQLVIRLRAGEAPRSLVERFRHAHLAREAPMMVARTLKIDKVVRHAQNPQVVILGAGLDGRAWRMAELEDSVVFEVDHPASQREKRSRSERLKPTARDVRFVPVDFTRDALAEALADAGHDPTRPTTWIWEGVVMYLDRRDVEATLQVVQKRSSLGSRLIIAYHQPALMLFVIALIVRFMGEPIRTVLKPKQMLGLLDRYAFKVRSDEDIATLGALLSSDLAKATRLMKHLRIVVADRFQNE